MKYPFPVPNPSPNPNCNTITPQATSEDHAHLRLDFPKTSLTIEGNTGHWYVGESVITG